MRPVGQSRVAGYPHRLGDDVTDGLPHTERRDEYATKTDTRRADRGAIVGAGQNRVNRPLDKAPQAGSAGLHSTGAIAHDRVAGSHTTCASTAGVDSQLP